MTLWVYILLLKINPNNPHAHTRSATEWDAVDLDMNINLLLIAHGRSEDGKKHRKWEWPYSTIRKMPLKISKQGKKAIKWRFRRLRRFAYLTDCGKCYAMRALFSLHRPRDTIPLQFVPYFGHESERNSMSGREVNRLWSSSAMRSPMNYTKRAMAI